MNSLSNVKRKIMQFSLTPASQRILNEFSAKYGTNKSIVIDRALEMLAAKYHMTISIHYELTEHDPEIKIDEKLLEIANAKIFE